MTISELYNFIDYDLYFSSNKLFINSDGWEIWTKHKDRWIRRGEIRKKDFNYDFSIARKLTNHKLVEITLDSDTTYHKLIKFDEEPTALDEAKDLNNRIQDPNRHSIYLDLDRLKLIKSLEEFDYNSLTPEEEKRYTIAFKKFLDRLETNNLKSTKVTTNLNKEKKIESYKKEIENYIKKGNFTTLNNLCRDLKINKATFYTYELNLYLNNIITK